MSTGLIGRGMGVARGISSVSGQSLRVRGPVVGRRFTPMRPAATMRAHKLVAERQEHNRGRALSGRWNSAGPSSRSR
eukprot:3465510-Pyramimonas_sp.AAC.2